MTVILEEKTTISVFKTNLPDIIVATYSSFDEDKSFSVYLPKDALSSATTVLDAKGIMREEGFYAYTPEGVEYLKGSTDISHAIDNFFELNRFVDSEKEITADQLYKDRRSYDGFVYQYGEEVPLNKPLFHSLYDIKRSRFTKDIEGIIEAHPWVEIEEIRPSFDDDQVETWDLKIQLPDEEFKKVYRFAKANTDKIFHDQRLVDCLVWESQGYENALDIFKTIGYE